MRSIKFRAWDKVTKSMRYGAEHSLTMCLMNSNDFELMQYTGLKDKNGKEIYEGDIVRVTIYGFGIEKDIVAEWTKDGYEGMCEDFHREVIGNIYETNLTLE